MTSTLDIENVSDDNKKSYFRSQKIKVSGKQFVTPLRAIDPTKMASGANIYSKARGLFEVYRTLKPERIQQLLRDAGELTSYSNELRRAFSKAESTDLKMCFVRYKGEAGAFPNKNEVERLAAVAHSYSDITPIPAVSETITEANFPKFLVYLKAAHAEIDEANQKPIMGLLPIIPPILYPQLLDYYLGKGVNSFYFDFGGKTPNHLMLRPIRVYLSRKKKLDDSLLYLLNTNYGRAMKNAEVLPAKDFGAFGYGADVLGGLHVSPKRRPEFYEWLRKHAGGAKPENIKRVFIKNDYGYHKVGAKAALEAIYPKETAIRADDIVRDPTRNYQKLFNMEQQAIEAKELSKRLSELGKNDSILDYISGKEQIKGEMAHFRIKQHQSKLF